MNRKALGWPEIFGILSLNGLEIEAVHLCGSIGSLVLQLIRFKQQQKNDGARCDQCKPESNLKWELTGCYRSHGDLKGIVDSEIEWRVCGFLS